MTGVEESILVVPREIVIPGEGWLGLREVGMEQAIEAIGGHGRFAPRGPMEVDPAFKQIIPYLVLRDGERWFLMRRTNAGGDQRLHDRWSIGVGGHVNPGDDGVVGGLRREWREELVADFEPPFRLVGLLNDDSTPVGTVHLGLVFAADAEGRQVRIRETHKLSGEFADTSAVRAVRDDMETWSRLVFDALTGAFAITR